jgi:hypothetical protein
MAEAGLFIGWNLPVRGREEKAVQVFGETMAYWASLEEDGKIEGSQAAFLRPHGGDLGGFMLIRGTREQMAAVQQEEEFNRFITRAGLVVDGFGVVPVFLDDGVAEQMQLYQEMVPQLT